MTSFATGECSFPVRLLRVSSSVENWSIVMASTVRLFTTPLSGRRCTQTAFGSPKPT